MTTFRGLDLARLKNRIKTQPWAAAVFAQVRKDVAPMIARGVTVFPAERPSGWMHNFTCPTCAELLKFDLDSPESHRCRLCNGVYSTPDLNAAWVYQYNKLMIDTAAQACLVCALDGEVPAGEWARDVLLSYTATYATYEPHGSHAGKGKIQAQSLDEAVWMLPAVRVYQSLRDLGLLPEAESERVRVELFAPAIELLRPQTNQVHNIHLWHASAIWAMAVELGSALDQKFAETEIGRNVTEGVLPDGSWYEGSPHYHFYTIHAFISYLLAARVAGKEPIMVEQLKKMFTSQLLLLRPDWEFPAFNDGWPANPLPLRAPLYELAQYLFGGFEPVLHTMYAICGEKRSSMEALLYGPDEIAPSPIEFPRVAVVDGVAVVRRGDYVGYVKSTPQGGGHDHNDKPGVYLYSANGKLNAADLGNPGYGNPLHGGYFRRTHSHNTVVVDDKDQPWSDGRIISAQDFAHYSLITSANDDAYPGVKIRRWTCFGENWVVDRTLVVCEEPHELLWLFHTDGTLEVNGQPDWQEGTFTENGHFTGQRLSLLPGEGIEVIWRSKSPGELWRMHVQTAGDASAGTAEAPNLPATESVGVFAVKTQGTALDVCSTFALSQTAPKIEITRNEAGSILATIAYQPPTELQVRLGW